MSQTIHERLHRALGAQEVENIKTRHAYLHAMSHSFEEWDQLWVHCDDTTWAHYFGRMVGWDEMFYGSVEKYDRDMLSLYDTMTKINPKIIGRDPLACCLGGLHSLASGVIEVAEDGQSARSFFLTPGTLCSCNMPSGRRDGAMCWERYGSDFVYRDGKWYYIHEHVCPDLNFSYDVGNWAYDTFTGKSGGGPGGAGGPGGGGGGEKPDRNPPCTDPGPLHHTWAITQTVQDALHWPVPYKTLDDENSYAPGHNDAYKPIISKKGYLV